MSHNTDNSGVVNSYIFVTSNKKKLFVQNSKYNKIIKVNNYYSIVKYSPGFMDGVCHRIAWIFRKYIKVKPMHMLLMKLD